MTGAGSRLVAVALHEAAHGVIGCRLGYRPRLVRLEPPETAFQPFSPAAWADELVIVAAGGAAVRLLAGSSAPGNAGDEHDTDEARAIVARAGVGALALADARRCAEDLVTTHRAAIERVAADLLATGSQTGDRVRQVIGGATVDQAALFLLRLATAESPRERITT